MSESLMPVVTAMSGGVQEQVGWFHYEMATDSWMWSPELFLIHGLRPGEIVSSPAC